MEQQQFVETLSTAQGQLNVLNEVGTVTILPHNGRSVIVDAASRHMTITVTRSGDIVTVRAQVDEDWREQRSWLDSLLNNDHPKADLTIQVPADCEVNAKTVTGKLTIQDLHSAVNGRVITGSAVLSNLTGPIYAKTITGKLEYTGALAAANHRFESITGAVHLNLTQLPNARLDARAATGHIHCNFPLKSTVRRHNLVGARLADVLGDGAGQLRARVVTGGVHLTHVPSIEKAADIMTA